MFHKRLSNLISRFPFNQIISESKEIRAQIRTLRKRVWEQKQVKFQHITNLLKADETLIALEKELMDIADSIAHEDTNHQDDSQIENEIKIWNK